MPPRSPKLPGPTAGRGAQHLRPRGRSPGPARQVSPVRSAPTRRRRRAEHRRRSRRLVAGPVEGDRLRRGRLDARPGRANTSQRPDDRTATNRYGVILCLNVMKPGPPPGGTLAGAGPARRCRKEAGCHGARRVGLESHAAGCACDGRVGGAVGGDHGAARGGWSGRACRADRWGVRRAGVRGDRAMNGARFVHDQLELAGWQVEIADAQKVKGLAPLACKTDKIDAWVLAELSRRDLVPAIWLPTPTVRAEREQARWRLHLVRHRTALKNRIHATLLAFGHPCPVSDLFGVGGRELLTRLELPEPWAADV